MTKPATTTTPPAEGVPCLAIFADLCKVEPERFLEVLHQGCENEEDVALVERFRAYANLTTDPAPLLALIRKFPASKRSTAAMPK